MLAIAARRFAEFGFDTTTMREIAKDANILSGSVYYYFETKEDMLHEVVGAAAEVMEVQSAKIEGAEYDAEVKLVALMLLSFDQLFSDRHAFAILYNERQYFRRSDAFAYVAQAQGVRYKAWQKVIWLGIRQEIFRAATNPFLTISTVIRMLNTCADWYCHDGGYDPRIARHSQDEVIAFNLEFVLRALRVSKRIGLPVPLEAAKKLVAEIGKR